MEATHRVFAAPESPTNDDRHAPHVCDVDAQGPRFNAVQLGAASQVTAFSTVLPTARVCNTALLLPAPTDNCESRML